LIDAHLAREPAEVACRMHHFSGTPFAVRMRGGDVHSNPSPMIVEIVRYAAAVCPMSQFLADVLVGRRVLQKMPQGLPVKVEPGRLHVVPNSLPAKYHSTSPVPQSDQQQVIGAVGRLVPIKRFQDLIEAVAPLVPEFPGLKLKIVGGGVMLAELQALASRLGIAGRIEITGFQSWHSVMAMIRQFHIYIQTSELEGCSLANIEAGFQGIPLLLSRTGANEQCVEPGVNGYIFDPGDVTELSARLRMLFQAGPRKREQMGKASLHIVGSRFSAEKVMPLVETIFQDAINNSQPGRMSFSTRTA
jgi:glycosyltransferase involved in cell wall biosynthesis